MATNTRNHFVGPAETSFGYLMNLKEAANKYVEHLLHGNPYKIILNWLQFVVINIFTKK